MPRPPLGERRFASRRAAARPPARASQLRGRARRTSAWPAGHCRHRLARRQCHFQADVVARRRTVPDLSVCTSLQSHNAQRKEVPTKSSAQAARPGTNTYLKRWKRSTESASRTFARPACVPIARRGVNSHFLTAREVRRDRRRHGHQSHAGRQPASASASNWHDSQSRVAVAGRQRPNPLLLADDMGFADWPGLSGVSLPPLRRVCVRRHALHALLLCLVDLQPVARRAADRSAAGAMGRRRRLVEGHHLWRGGGRRAAAVGGDARRHAARARLRDGVRRQMALGPAADVLAGAPRLRPFLGFAILGGHGVDGVGVCQRHGVAAARARRRPHHRAADAARRAHGAARRLWRLLCAQRERGAAAVAALRALPPAARAAGAGAALVQLVGARPLRRRAAGDGRGGGCADGGGHRRARQHADALSER